MGSQRTINQPGDKRKADKMKYKVQTRIDGQLAIAKVIDASTRSEARNIAVEETVNRYRLRGAMLTVWIDGTEERANA